VKYQYSNDLAKANQRDHKKLSQGSFRYRNEVKMTYWQTKHKDK
jgi:hypothetical protein